MKYIEFINNKISKKRINEIKSYLDHLRSLRNL